MGTNTYTGIIRDPRDTQAKVRLFRRRFLGQPNVWGTYNRTGKSWQMKGAVTDEIIVDHLLGKRPYGAYLLMGDTTRAVAVDFDHDNPLPVLEYVERCRHYGLPAYVERSKSKGFHVWGMFSESGVKAWKARRVFQYILEELEIQHIEIFPKQDRLPEDGTHYGNFINAPFFGSLVLQGKTVFVDPKKDLTPFPNQWEFLDQVESIPEARLDEIIEVNDITGDSVDSLDRPLSLGTFQASWSLPPCMRRMLDEGVTSYQRVSCFRLAVQLRRAGLPFDIAVAALYEWSLKNRPDDGKHIITGTEVKAQVAAAFMKEYRGCGCADPALQPFCDTSCFIYKASAPRTE